MLLRDAVDDYLFDARRLSPQTYRWYADKLRAFEAWCDGQQVTTLEALDGRTLRRYFEYQRNTLTPRTKLPVSTYTQRGYAQVVKQFLRWCGREGYCERGLYERVALPRVDVRTIKTLSPRQIEALFDACRYESRPLLAIRDRATLSVLLATGIRAGELCGLTVEQVHLDRDDAYLLIRGKGRKEREVSLGERAHRDLRRWLRVRPTGHPQVFTGKGGPLTVSGLDQLLYRLRDWAGAEQFEGIRVSAHTLRHTYARMTMELPGSDVFMLKEQMGHSAIATTLRYLKDFQQRTARRGPNAFDQMR
jgi:site-specific recombinase XerD